jgi:hypothetical protein
MSGVGVGCGEDERERERRPAVMTERARSKVVGLGELVAGPGVWAWVGESLLLLEDEPDPWGLLLLAALRFSEAGGCPNQIGYREGVIGIVIRE